MKIHSGENPLSYEVCGLVFLQNYFLKTHTRIHTGDKHFLEKFVDQHFLNNAF